MNNLSTNHNVNESRGTVDQYYSAEIELDGVDFPYQFKIWNFASNLMCVLVKEDSDILPRLKVGDTLEMKYYSADAAYSSEHKKTAIRDIAKNDQGRFKGHYLVALEILGSLPTTYAQESSSGLGEKELFEKARELMNEGKYNEAIHSYSSVIDVNPNHAASYINRAVTYKKLGNNSMALNDLKIAAKLGIKKAQKFLKSKGITYENELATKCGQ